MCLLTYKSRNPTFVLVDTLFHKLSLIVTFLEHHVNHLLWFSCLLCDLSFEQPRHLFLFSVPLLILLKRLLMPLLLVLLYSYLLSFVLKKLSCSMILGFSLPFYLLPFAYPSILKPIPPKANFLSHYLPVPYSLRNS